MLKKTLLCSCLLTAFSSLATDNLTGGDPLAAYQWNLHNSGQHGLAAKGGKAGEDLNLLTTDLLGIKGEGVTVTVVDSGVELNHPDLVNNVAPGSLNLLTGSTEPTDNSGHGTAVAGIIAAEADNNLGGRGVAPSAKIVGFNYLDAQSMSSWLQSHGVPLNGAASSRVYNQSYSSKPAMFTNADAEQSLSLQLKQQVMQDVSLNSNNGLGAIFVKSAGNAFKYYDTFIGDTEFRVLPFENQQRFNNTGLPFHDANLSTDNSSFWNLVVSAYNADGRLASYSSVGANVFLTAPGGEAASQQAGIVTTDLSGCDNGFNNYFSNTDQALQASGLDTNCDATAAMYGTSAAAAAVSGAAALVMSANPQLDARTVKHILTTTARKIDANHSGIDLNFADNNGNQLNYKAIPGWQQNAAGYHFHYFYGLGAVDVDAAVAKALQTTASLPALQITDWQSNNTALTIPDASIAGVQDSMQLTDNLTIEAVQLKFSVTHQRMRDLAIELISPSGTRSVLLSPRTGVLNVTGDTVQNAVLLSQHFYGEPAAGEWQIRVLDTDNGSSQTLVYSKDTGLLSVNDTNNSTDGTLLSWSLRVYGH
ncbi:S8 family serine peptidase [Rheinheimera sp.]|uniref:S8 family serine peptidase n=1 Tax=Rheinheimera sp. TaxID=1869214 RepID=UPI0040489884